MVGSRSYDTIPRILDKFYGNKNMKKYLQLLLFMIILSFKTITSFAVVLPPMPAVLNNSQQLLLVLSPTWDSHQGTLQRYERQGESGNWILVSEKSIPVVVGKNGMAWAPNLLQPAYQLPHSDKKKQEGDGRSPIGVYDLGTAFGFASDASLIPQMKWPYLALKSSSICVDDRTSHYYNQLIDSSTKADWNPKTTGEQMLTVIPQYTWGSVIHYNQNNVVGDGSCIFMHVWKGPDSVTAGCVAMDQDELVKILGWLDPEKKPVIGMFPIEAYKYLQRAWGLPVAA